MTLKHRKSSYFPNLDGIKDPETKKVLSLLFRTLQDSFKNIFDDLDHGSSEGDSGVFTMDEIISAVIAYLLRGAAKGDMFFVNRDGDGNLFIDLLNIGANTMILTTEGTVPLWDYVGGLPGAVTLLQQTKLIYIVSFYDLETILISETIDSPEATIDLDIDFDVLEQELEDLITTNAEDIITMNETIDQEVTLDLDIGMAVA